MFDKKRIKQIITENWNDLNNYEIAEILNKEGLITRMGKTWTSGTVSYYATKQELTVKRNRIKTFNSNFKKSEIDILIISNLKKLKLDDICQLLNEKGFFNNVNQPWIKSTLSYYINNHLPEYKTKSYRQTKVKQSFQNQEPILTPEIKTEQQKEIVLTAQQRLDLIDSSIFESEGKFFTDSLSISKIFDKEHRDVLKAINNCEVSENFRSANFCTDLYFDNYNRKQPKINLTKKGFSFVVMGFTGEKASQFKESYINRFEELEEQVKQPKQELITDPLTIMSMSIEALKKTNEKVNKLELDLAEVKTNITAEVKQANKELEAKVDTIYNHSQKEIRLAQNRLKQTTLDLNVEETPKSYYDRTKEIVLDYTVAEGLKKEDSGINYGKLYGAMERAYQIPFRQNLCDLNQQRPSNKQVSTIRYFKECGLEKELFEMACRLFAPLH